MAKIAIELKNCKGCPHFTTGNHWSSDGWDRMEDWICKKSGDKVIAPSVEWMDEKHLTIPDWCPIKVE